MKTRPAVVVALLSGGLGSALAASPPVFSDATAETGIDSKFLPPTGVLLTPHLGGGGAGDFNGDGWQDLFVPSGGHKPDRLFINNGDGTFTDLAADWNVDVSHFGGGMAIGDYDNDGNLDIFLASHGGPDETATGVHKLYRNTGSSFEEVADAAGLNDTPALEPDGYGAAWGDYDLDGDLDLCLASWLDAAEGNRLFRNEGDGTFTDITAETLGSTLDGVNGFSPRFADMNGDRYPELLLVADFASSRYYVNDGAGGYQEYTAESGTGIDSNGMGTDVGDLNGDGLLDWYVTSIQTLEGFPWYTGNMLYINQGNHQFAEVSVETGTKDGGWGWATEIADFDNDGDLDIAENNGYPVPLWGSMPRRLWVNDGTGAFEEIAEEAGFADVDDGRGLLAIDHDNDGDLGLVSFAFKDPAVFYRNDTEGPDTNWLRVVLTNGGDPAIAPDGYGTRLEADVADKLLVRYVSPGATYISQSDLRVHFGLGEAEAVDELRVMWPDGRTTTFNDVAANAELQVNGCRADIDGDGRVNVFDAVAFQTGFMAQDPGLDMNGDGELSIEDWMLFVELLRTCG